MSVIVVGANWLHLTATILLLGYFTILSFFVLPVLARSLAGADLGSAIAAIERRAMPFVIASLIAFLATGIYLLGNDARYGGVGSLDSTWATALLVKHGVIVGMLVLGVYVDAQAVRAGSAIEDPDAATAVRRFTLGAGGLTFLGLVVLLLTAVVQAS